MNEVFMKYGWNINRFNHELLVGRKFYRTTPVIMQKQKEKEKEKEDEKTSRYTEIMPLGLLSTMLQ